jgi:hypothetical protein
MKNSKALMRILIPLVLLVWGIIAYRIYDSLGGDAEGATVRSVVSDSTDHGTSRFVFSSDVRDPFSFAPPRLNRNAEGGIKAVHEQVWLPPPLKLTGIINQQKRKSAVLEQLDGSVYFMHEGDTLHGVKILNISTQGVAYLYQKKKSQWELLR